MGGGGTARLTADPRQRGIQTSHSAADRRRCSTATTRPFTQIHFSSVEDGSLMPRPVLRSLENPAQLTWVLAGLRDLGASVPPQPAVPAPRRAQPHGLIGSRPSRPAPQHPISSEACVSRPIPTPIGGPSPTTPHWLITRSRPGGNQVWAGPWVGCGRTESPSMLTSVDQRGSVCYCVSFRLIGPSEVCSQLRLPLQTFEVLVSAHREGS